MSISCLFYSKVRLIFLFQSYTDPTLFNVYPPIDLKNPPYWSMVTTGGAIGDMTLDTTDLLNAGFKLLSDTTNYKVKVFVLDGADLVSSNMKPLANVVTLP